MNTSTLANSERKAGIKTEAIEQVKTERLSYIDNIRIVLTVLVILVHVAVTYGAVGDWTYIEPRPSDTLTEVLLTLFVIDCQSFFMGLFFFLAGYFTPGSYDRKGGLRFWKDRILHIGVPMILYIFFLSRVPNYVNAYGNNGITLSFWEYSKRTFISQADQGPAWFLFVLLIFALGYTIIRFIGKRFMPGISKRLQQIPTPNTLSFLGFGLLISVIMFAIAQLFAVDSMIPVLGIFNFLLAFFPSYILLYFLGALAYRNQWLTKLPREMLKFWRVFSIALIVALPVFLISSGAMEYGLDPYLQGMNWRCAVTLLWFGMACVSFSLTIVLSAREKTKAAINLPLFNGPNTFGAYWIHPLVIVPLAYLMSFTEIHSMVKFLLVSISGVAISFLAAEILRKIPLIKNIL